MTAQQIRDRFTDFFVKHGHKKLPSSSLLPDNDPTVLLTTAGMQQFKPYFLGEQDPTKDFGSKRVTTIQKSFRTSDIDEVGDVSHLTFFEMLGNFSFGDYWKAEAIDMAWDFLTKEMDINPERLWVTIFAGENDIPRDSEAEAAWLKHVPKERIIDRGRKDNFWGPPGKSGSCGPSSEIHVHLNTDATSFNETDFLEVWNLVFTEYFQDEQGVTKPLPQKNIDTGMGLERLAMVVQKKLHIFATDIYQPIMAAADSLAGFGGQDSPAVYERRLRIIADHIRAAIFLLADGVRFSNKDQGYILRRLVRRAADQCLTSQFSFDPVAKSVLDHFSQAYPELRAHEADIFEHLNAELEQYRKVLNLDVTALVKRIRHGQLQSEREPVSGESHIGLTPDEAFTLYATHGISLDRMQRLGFGFDRRAVEAQIAKHQEISRAGSIKKFGGHGLNDPDVEKAYSDEQRTVMTRLHTATHLLHAALRQVLGPEVSQRGSDINPERLRFDFSFHRKLTDDEKLAVEGLVNEKISANLLVTKALLPFQQALDDGALAFFKEKYPAEVTVYTIGTFSKELCGGPHVTHTSAIGAFRMTAEQSVGTGMRRIKATVS